MNRIAEFLLPPQRSTVAQEVDSLFHFINIVGGILLFGIVAAIIYFVIKYRRKSDDDVTPVIRHNTRLEILWATIPTILILIVFAWGFRGFLTLSTPPDDAYEINVTAEAWFWEFHYGDSGSSMNELVVPVGRPVKLNMMSTDYIHSFYVPDYRVKMDVLPNRYTTVWFEVTEPGESIAFCAEYCGAQHSNMLATVRAVEEDEFQEWLETGLEIDEDMPLAELGEMVYTNYGCNACHSTDGTDGVGPTFQGLYGTERPQDDGTSPVADAGYIRESIIEPNARVTQGFDPVMPSYAGRISDREIEGIIEFIRELQ